MDIIKKLNNIVQGQGGTMYYVGGYVRDQLLGKQNKDIDLLITGVNPTIIEPLLQNELHIKLVGKTFGVYKAYLDDYDLDIAFPRKEISTGTGHKDFDVIVDTNITLEEDLQRRDFTINAMAMRVDTGELIDPFNGKKDLDRKLIRQITDNSIQEDYLRALRAIQFASRFKDFTIEKETFYNIKKHQNLIKTISPERIRMELEKMLNQGLDIIKGFNYLLHSGLLKAVLPEIEAMNDDRYNILHHKYNTYFHTLHSLNNYMQNTEYRDMEIMLAILLHDTGKPVTLSQDEFGIYHNYDHEKESGQITHKVLNRLKFDNITIDNVFTLVTNHMQISWTKQKVRRLMSRYDYITTLKIIEVIYYDQSSCNHQMSVTEYEQVLELIHEVKEKQEALKITDLEVNGHDMMELGLQGKQIGDMLKFLLDQVLENPELRNRDHLLKMVLEKMKRG